MQNDDVVVNFKELDAEPASAPQFSTVRLQPKLKTFRSDSVVLFLYHEVCYSETVRASMVGGSATPKPSGG